MKRKFFWFATNWSGFSTQPKNQSRVGSRESCETPISVELWVASMPWTEFTVFPFFKLNLIFSHLSYIHYTVHRFLFRFQIDFSNLWTEFAINVYFSSLSERIIVFSLFRLPLIIRWNSCFSFAHKCDTKCESRYGNRLQFNVIFWAMKITKK